jgi:hypothetical protein
MASLLVLTNNQTTNPTGGPLTLDLTNYVVVDPGQGLDPADPAFTQRIWSRSLLKEGATLALEQLVEREMQFPLKLGPIGGAGGSPQNLSATLALIQQINQILQTPGTTMTWQPPGASQPTTFDVLSGLVESAYNYRAEQQSWEIANLRVFTQPLGRTVGPRTYAAASGVGPLLMLTPYGTPNTAGGAIAQVVGASTQAGLAGFGGASQGGVPSSGIFYQGAPSLAGDAPALLHLSYTGPVPNNATNSGIVPYAVLSTLPDYNYQVLFPKAFMHKVSGTASSLAVSGAVASQYWSVPSGLAAQLAFPPFVEIVPGAWAGNHRLFAIARASQSPRQMGTVLDAFVNTPTVATVTTADWTLYDLGTFAIRASQTPTGGFGVAASLNVSVPAAAGTLDLCALAMVPDNTSWFLSPGFAAASQYATNLLSSNTFVIDDTFGEQYMYFQPTMTQAPSPLGTNQLGTRVTQYSRGLVPQPDPRNGLPILSLLAVGQAYAPSVVWQAGASWANPQNLQITAQVGVLERTRYVLS